MRQIAEFVAYSAGRYRWVLSSRSRGSRPATEWMELTSIASSRRIIHDLADPFGLRPLQVDPAFDIVHAPPPRSTG
jgi:hypothetical protein